MKHQIASFAGVYLAITGSVGATELLQNGSFESGDFTGWSLNDPSGFTYIEPTTYGYGAQKGNWYVYAGPPSTAPGTLSQTFSDISGDKLTISGWAIGDTTTSFDANGQPVSNLGQVSYFLDGNLLGSPDLTSGKWTNSMFTATATGNDTFTIKYSNDASYNGLDNFSVTEVASGIPEMPTWALLLIGFAASAGWTLRGRARANYAPHELSRGRPIRLFIAGTRRSRPEIEGVDRPD